MRKVLILAVFMFFGIICQAKTLIPLPNQVEFLPDFPNIQVSSYYDVGLEYWESALTTEWIRRNVFYSYAGWTTSKKRWVFGAGLDIGKLLSEISVDNPLGIYKVGIKFFLTYGLDMDLNKRCWAGGIGFDWANIRCK